MKIGIEAQRIFRPKKHGMDFVALELIKALQQIDQVNEYFIFVKPDTDRKVFSPSPNFHLVEVQGQSYPLWEQYYLPKAARRCGVDLLHCTSNTAPVLLSIPALVTLHDIIYLEGIDWRKGTAYQRLGNLYRRWVVPRILPACQKILTVSDFENQRITEKFGFPAGKVVTAYNAFGAHFQTINQEQVLRAAKEKLGLPDRFIFFLGNTDPKKNVTNVLKALTLLKRRGQLSLPLVMLDYDAGHLERQLRQIGAPDLLDDIILCGYVPNAQLPYLYNTATVFLYPSLRESFGIPILEAMACGAPVITSRTSAMPEVAGDAAVLVDPYNPEDIAAQLQTVLTDEARRRELRKRGLARAAQFSWSHTARQVLQIYEEVVNGGHPSVVPIGEDRAITV